MARAAEKSLKGGITRDNPSLSQLAFDVLSIPASSCKCERMFSELSDLLEPCRRAIQPQLLAAIQCVLNFSLIDLQAKRSDFLSSLKSSRSLWLAWLVC
jgi:hypothetical protein